MVGRSGLVRVSLVVAPAVDAAELGRVIFARAIPISVVRLTTCSAVFAMVAFSRCVSISLAFETPLDVEVI